ncbi:hypothetical protein BJV77DRAFT_981102 [Russula vinacea]|nr:hypothetical protein BJV77DRAFT_981102 [Russula vinacea]
MTTAGLEPATFWCRWRSKPNALPLRQVALLELYLSFHDHDQPRSTSAMALNWTMLKPDRTPVPLPGELTIMTVESGADVSLTVPDEPPTGSSSSGGSGGGRKLNGTGKLVLTDQPIPGFQLLSIDIRPSPDGGLTSGTKSEIRLKNEGIFQFVSLLEKTRERAVYMRRQMKDEEDALRTMSPFPCYCILILWSAAYVSPSQGPSRGGGTPVDAPPGYEA